MIEARQTVCPSILFNPELIPSPCFVLDEEQLLRNMRILDYVQEKSGVKILLALKGYAAWATFPLLSRQKSGPLWGVCASSVDEARLGREEFGGEVHAFAPAWTWEEVRELLNTADHILFNSLQQWRAFRPLCLEANQTFRREKPLEFGLRLNHEHSEGAPAIYNPASPNSRLGIKREQLEKASSQDLEEISGLHFHSLCEQGADALSRTLDAFANKFEPWLSGRKWLNFGGGHHLTRKGYDLDLLISLLKFWRGKYGAQIYLEPGEAVALEAGWLTTTVLDIVEGDVPTAILDASAACHMPDVLEMPYKPEVWQMIDGKPKLADSGNYIFRLGGKSCLAGDVIGQYEFSKPLQIGDRIVFGDMAIYSMVKTTTFNGLRLPSIGILKSNTNQERSFELLHSFSYADFKSRLS